ncbi:leucine-rich repeat-containing protein 74B isoform X1 [Mustela erminea]|uniref:leucine-rich repeat-containing protein 74B isoform X1 n=1 Tax=Mustela erminea TaxID=36723 RepID=UPI001386DFE0|nr:leucine-rich repeat-containing protein 74B isoform X1 [Mustela erminea]
MRARCQRSGVKEEQEKEVAAASGRLAGPPEAEEGSVVDSDSDQEMEGIRGPGELTKDTLYLRSCQAHRVVPASCFLRQGRTPELNLRHRGLGPQGARALASALTSNPYVKRLDLRDNGLCGAGVEALAGALRKTSIISDVDLSENQMGVVGAQAICAALTVNPTMQKVQLAGNGLEEHAARYLAELLLAHTGLKSLDLSYNQLNDHAGEILGPALAENTGLTELNISWNHLRGPGAVAFARGLEVSWSPSFQPQDSYLEPPTFCSRSVFFCSSGLLGCEAVVPGHLPGGEGAGEWSPGFTLAFQANIFLRVLDISYNGFGDPGASAVGEALKTNNVLEELSMSNNRISAVGALSLGLGLRVNQTLRILVVSASLMGEVPLYMSTQIPPLPCLSTPLAVEYTGSKSQIREGGLLASSCDLLLSLAIHSSISGLTHALLPTPPSSLLPSQQCHPTSQLAFLFLSPSGQPRCTIGHSQTYPRPHVHTRGSFLQGCQGARSG